MVARKHHGTDDLENLALACFACNNHKGANIAGIDPTTGELTRLFHPRRDRWEEHFEWDDAVLLGRTPIGRTTVDVLAVNLSHRIQLRKALRDEGSFSASAPLNLFAAGRPLCRDVERPESRDQDRSVKLELVLPQRVVDSTSCLECVEPTGAAFQNRIRHVGHSVSKNLAATHSIGSGPRSPRLSRQRVTNAHVELHWAAGLGLLQELLGRPRRFVD